jgi:hypothetical protein
MDDGIGSAERKRVPHGDEGTGECDIAGKERIGLGTRLPAMDRNDGTTRGEDFSRERSAKVAMADQENAQETHTIVYVARALTETRLPQDLGETGTGRVAATGSAAGVPGAETSSRRRAGRSIGSAGAASGRDASAGVSPELSGFGSEGVAGSSDRVPSMTRSGTGPRKRSPSLPTGESVAMMMRWTRVTPKMMHTVWKESFMGDGKG